MRIKNVSVQKWMGAACAAAAFLLTPSLAQATIVYGDFAGTTVTYKGVFEDDKGLFESPSIVGDSLFFSPSAFDAQSVNGNGLHTGPGPVDFVDGTLGFELVANDGLGLSSFTLEESGAFSLEGLGTAFTKVKVSVTVSVNVLEANGSPVVGPSQFATTTILLDETLVSSPGLGQAWIGKADIDIQALAAGIGINGTINRARVVIDNTLLAISENGTVAFVDKKNIDGVVITTPEPGSVVLVVIGGAAMLYRRRRSAA